MRWVVHRAHTTAHTHSPTCHTEPRTAGLLMSCHVMSCHVRCGSSCRPMRRRARCLTLSVRSDQQEAHGPSPLEGGDGAWGHRVASAARRQERGTVRSASAHFAGIFDVADAHKWARCTSRSASLGWICSPCSSPLAASGDGWPWRPSKPTRRSSAPSRLLPTTPTVEPARSE